MAQNCQGAANPINQQLRDALKDFVEGSDKSKRKLSKEMGMCANQVWLYLNNLRGFSLSEAVKIARYINFDLNSLKE